MFTNKAITELHGWADAAIGGKGDLAKEHLEAFRHIAAGLVVSQEFQGRSQQVCGRKFEPDDLSCMCNVLDLIAQIEVNQVEAYGPATMQSPISS